MPDISVRRATPPDTEIVAYYVHALLDELSGGKAPAQDAILKTAQAVLASDRVIAAIACVDDRPVGIMTLNECAAIYAGGTFGEISELYVAPQNRSHGIAQHLLEFALQEGHARGWARLEVGAPLQPEWQRSLAFYLSQGFEETGPRLRRLLHA